MRYAAAYLRRSAVTAGSPGDASREAQLAAVRALCGPEVVAFEDWGLSGQRADRPGYQALRAEIAAGRVATVCAYSLSRFGRSTRELLDFVALCQEHGVTLRTKVESIDTSTAAGRFALTVLAAVAELEAELARERSAAAREAKRARGDHIGPVPYGRRLVDGRLVEDPARPLTPLVEAYRRGGSVLAATRILEAEGVPAPRGGQRWSTSVLTRILRGAGVLGSSAGTA